MWAGVPDTWGGVLRDSLLGMSQILQHFQAKSDEFYRRKRESIFAQLTARGNSMQARFLRPNKTSRWGTARPRFLTLHTLL